MRILICFIFLLLSISSFTQELKAGVKAGYILSNQVITNETFNFKPLSNFHFGFVFSLPISEKVTFQPEISYSIKGSKYNGGKIKMSFIEVPLLFAYKINKFNVLLGPQYSHIVGVNRKDNFASFKSRESAPQIGLAMGLEYSITSSFSLGTRVQKDFLYASIDLGQANFITSNNNEDPAIPSNFASSNTKALQIYLTYFFK